MRWEVREGLSVMHLMESIPRGRDREAMGIRSDLLAFRDAIVVAYHGQVISDSIDEVYSIQ